MKLTEKQIETQILDYLALCKGFRCYKINNVGIFDKKIGKLRTVQNKHAPKGPADIWGSVHGRALYIEVKTPAEHKYLIKHYDEIKSGIWCPKKDKKKHHLKQQIQFIESNRAMGCLAFFASSISQVKYEIQAEAQ